MAEAIAIISIVGHGLAGAFYGEEQIPSTWRLKLSMRETIVNFADRLLLLSSNRRSEAAVNQIF